MTKSIRWILAFATIFFVPCTSAMAASSLYLCITDPGFAGDVTVIAYAGCSTVISSDLNAFLEATTPTSRELRVQKQTDSASNSLLGAFAAGTTIGEVKIKTVTSGGTPTEFRTYRLLNTRISSFAAPVAATDTSVVENVGFTFEKMETSFRKQNSGGAWLPWTYVCWNVVNQSVTPTACQ